MTTILTDADGNKFELIPFTPTGNHEQKGSFLVKPVQPEEEKQKYVLHFSKHHTTPLYRNESLELTPTQATALSAKLKQTVEEFTSEL